MAGRAIQNAVGCAGCTCARTAPGSDTAAERRVRQSPVHTASPRGCQIRSADAADALLPTRDRGATRRSAQECAAGAARRHASDAAPGYAPGRNSPVGVGRPAGCGAPESRPCRTHLPRTFGFPGKFRSVAFHSAAGIRPLQLQSLKILCKGSVWTLPFQHILAGQGSGSRARRMERPRREKKAKVDASALSALSNAKRGVVSRQQQVQVWRPAPANTPQRPRRALRGPPITCIPPRSGSRARTRPPGSGALCDRASTRGPAPARALACSRGVCARRRARSRRGACPSVRLGGVSPSCGGAPALRGCVPVGAVAARLHHRFAAARSVPRGRRHGRPRCSRARAAGARFRGPSPAARRRACYSAAAVPV